MAETLCARCQANAPIPSCIACQRLAEAMKQADTVAASFATEKPRSIIVSGVAVGGDGYREAPADGLTLTWNLGIHGAWPWFAGALAVGLLALMRLTTDVSWYGVLLILGALGLAGIGVHRLLQRATITVEGSVLTVRTAPFSPKATSVPVAEIDQLVLRAAQETWIYKGVKSRITYTLAARTPAGLIDLFTASHHEIRYVEAQLEAQFRILDDTTQNVVTTTRRYD